MFVHCDRIYVFNPSEIIPQFSSEGNNRLRVLGLLEARRIRFQIILHHELCMRLPAPEILFEKTKTNGARQDISCGIASFYLQKKRPVYGLKQRLPNDVQKQIERPSFVFLSAW